MRGSDLLFPAPSRRAGSVSRTLSRRDCPRSLDPRVSRDTPPPPARPPTPPFASSSPVPPTAALEAAEPAAVSLGPAGPFRGRDPDCRAVLHPAVAWRLCPLPSVCSAGPVVSFSPLPRPGMRPDEAKLNQDAVGAASVTTEIPWCGDTGVW